MQSLYILPITYFGEDYRRLYPSDEWLFMNLTAEYQTITIPFTVQAIKEDRSCLIIGSSLKQTCVYPIACLTWMFETRFIVDRYFPLFTTTYYNESALEGHFYP